MDSIPQLEARRLAILDSIKAIRSMRRGSISEQFFPVLRRGQKQTARRGPYYVLTRHRGSRTVSQRLITPEALRRAREDVEGFKRFQALCREYEQLTEKLGEVERGTEPEKKRSKSGLKKTGK
ncbi:MAG: hypothetical protein A2W03_04440 [Candidatus Aminicenantes bacterium RBG_16_63_16]|nr:MAG: hypothetical protein A2W03_04440 [Candidatus Aminicenantes bacterium RBG_16_63_16]